MGIELIIYSLLIFVQMLYGCIPIQQKPVDGSTPSTESPGYGNNTELDEQGTTILFIVHEGLTFECNFDFLFSFNKGIKIKNTSSSACSKIKNGDGQIVEFLGKHIFQVQSKEGFSLTCTLNAVFEEIADGISFVDQVVLQSLSCSSSPGQCLTEDGPDYPNTCSFPFIYQDRMYYACTDWKNGVRGDMLWCATETHSDQTLVPDKWSWCNQFCGYCGGKDIISDNTTSTASGTCKTLDGNLCKFPFKDGENEYTTCAHFKNLYQWCAVTTNQDGTYKEWEKCDPNTCQLEGSGECKTISGPDPHKSCVFPFKDGSNSYSSCVPFKSKYWCATTLKADGTYKMWGYCNSDGTCPMALSTRYDGRKRTNSKCGYDCFLNPNKKMVSFTDGLSPDALLSPFPIFGELTDSSWNILPDNKFQFMIGQKGVDLQCPEGTTFSKFDVESRIKIRCTGEYKYSITGLTSGKVWIDEENVNFGCNPCPKNYKAIAGYIIPTAILAEHNKETSIEKCEKTCEEMTSCQSFQFIKDKMKCILGDEKQGLGLSKNGHHVCKTKAKKCTTPMIAKANRSPEQESIREGEKVTYTCTGTPQPEMSGDPVISCGSNGLDKSLPVCRVCCDSIDMKFQIGMDHFDDIGYYDKYFLQNNLKHGHIWYQSLSGKYAVWRKGEVWALGETDELKVVAQSRSDGCPFDMDQSQWKTSLGYKNEKQQRDFIATFTQSCTTTPSMLLEIFTLPVGQGDSTIIKCPDNGPNIGEHTIVDMGSLKFNGKFGVNSAQAKLEYIKQVKDYISQAGYKVTNIFLSHPDWDHVNYLNGPVGLLAQLPNIPKMNVFLGGDEIQWTNAKKGQFVTDIKLNFNYKFIGLAGLAPINLCPQSGLGSAEVNMNILTAGNGNLPNEHSLVMKMTWNNFGMLFMGDFEGYDSFKALISNYKNNLKSDIILVPHHGADTVAGRPEKPKTATMMQAFYSFVEPQHVFISSHIGRNYGHPRCFTLDKVCFRGTVTFNVAGDIQGITSPIVNHVSPANNGQCWTGQISDNGVLKYGSCNPTKTKVHQTIRRLPTAYIENNVLYAGVSSTKYIVKELPYI